jgi:Acyl CoA:acetate/3-ketoacid CoA transferase
MSKIISAAQAAQLIKDGDVCAFSTMALAGYSQAIGDAITARYEKDHHPSGITVIHSCGSGDRKPGSRRGINGLAREGLVSTHICGHIANSYDMGKLIAENKVRSFLLPQGVVAHLYRSQAGKTPGVITKIGLNTFCDPRLDACRGNAAAASGSQVSELLELNGEEWLQYRCPDITVSVIRATTADEDGNLTTEHEAVQFEILPMAQAAHNNGGIVIAQVERIARRGSLKNKEIKVPGILVDYVVAADADDHPQTEALDYQPGLSGEIDIPLGRLDPVPLSYRKVIARRAAMELRPGMIVNLGLGMPDGLPSVIAEEDLAEQFTLTTELGTIGGRPGSGPYFGTSFNADAFMSHHEMFDFYNGGGLDITFLGFIQVDGHGNVNASMMGDMPVGPGGFINISQTTRKVCFVGTLTAGAKINFQDGTIKIGTEGKPVKFVNKLHQITFSGDYASQNGQEVLYITERCVFKLIYNKLHLMEIAEGIDLDRDILAMMEFKPVVSKDLKMIRPEIFRETWGGLHAMIMEKATEPQAGK